MSTPIYEARVMIRGMTHQDLAHVSAIELRSYEFPWSHGVFRDCLQSGYECVVLERDDEVAGYGVLSIAAGEAHILNICVDPNYRASGYGARLLEELMHKAHTAAVREVFLEVRPSNLGALALYKKKGFHLIANRPAYYQSREGREDACVLAKKLDYLDE